MLQFAGKGRPRQLGTLVNDLGAKVSRTHCQTLLEHLILDKKGVKVDPHEGMICRPCLLLLVLFLYLCERLL
jgi:hypothetical protein